MKARDHALAMQVQRKRQQGHGKPIISIEIGGQRLVAVKNRLMYSKGWKTFPDFLGDYVKTALGEEWGNAELAKPLEERHPILIWYQKHCELQRRFIIEPGKVSSMPLIGAAAAYLHLAYDLYALDHNAELQEKLIARLRDRDNFPGARYEVFVAAMFVRAGFDIHFEDEADRRQTHCEFTATHRETGKRFSVEAKRREGAKLRIGRLFNKALVKHADHMRVVCIDINMPDGATDTSKPEYLDPVLRGLRAFEGRPLNGQPRPPAYVIFTNTPWTLHLDGHARCSAIPEGFQIPDFKGDAMAQTLRQAIEARKTHKEMHELLDSMRDHTEIPSTFDGEIPEYAFGDASRRIVIGQRYLVPDVNGVERPAEVTTASVAELERVAYCGVTYDDGSAAICTMPLSDDELAAWKRHPDTFFGVLGQRKTRADSPLELYDFFHESARKTSKDDLLKAMAGAPDIQHLAKLDQPALADLHAERLTYGALALKGRR